MAQVAYIDVDDTLIRSAGSKRIPIPSVIRYVKRLKQEGWELFCWSSGGSAYAKASAEEVGIADCFSAFLPKPELIVDDVAPPQWLGLRVIHPAEISEPIQTVESNSGCAQGNPGGPL